MKKYFAILLSVLMLSLSSFGCFAETLQATDPTTGEVEVQEPVLKLDVIVDRQDAATLENSTGEVKNTNVTFVAKMDGLTSNSVPAKVIFYTGKPVLTVFPNELLGSAEMNENGVAKFRTYQKPGIYAGGAIAVFSDGKKIHSNVAYYEIPDYSIEPTLMPTVEPTLIPTFEPTINPTIKPTLKPTLIPTIKPTIMPTIMPPITPDPMKPVLDLNVNVAATSSVDSTGAQLVNNVRFVAKLYFPIENTDTTKNIDSDGNVVENTTSSSEELAEQMPIKIDFYVGDPDVKMYPAKYVGSAEMVNGKAVLAISQPEGIYAAGAIWARTPWGEIKSNVVRYKVPGIQKPLLKLKVDVAENAKDYVNNVRYTAAVLIPRPIESSNVDGALETEYDVYIGEDNEGPVADDFELPPDRTSPESTIQPVEPPKIDFYIGDPNTGTFPDKYIGSAYLKHGKAILVLSQKAGKYKAGAIYAMTPWGKLVSNIEYYKVPEYSTPVPRLSLRVRVANQPITTDEIADRYNVVYVAKYLGLQSSSNPVKVNFYTGKTGLYPNEYIGSAPVNEEGLAILRTYQRPGVYTGGSIVVLTETRSVYSNVVTYKVPALPVVEKPIPVEEVTFGEEEALKEEAIVREIDKSSPKLANMPATRLELHINDNNMVVDGVNKEIDAPPIIKDARTLVPIRALIEALGGNVEWVDSEKKAIIDVDFTTIIMQVNQTTVIVNGQEKIIDIPIQPINGRILVPARFVAENTGYQVNWDPDTQKVTIDDEVVW